MSAIAARNRDGDPEEIRVAYAAWDSAEQTARAKGENR